MSKEKAIDNLDLTTIISANLNVLFDILVEKGIVTDEEINQKLSDEFKRIEDKAAE
ncbi:hypothetical protein [Schinkia azotoformans]|uniref:hypothetical protein n=1 Tax=Schinkia azotoformans TaxID=1454 RepID=UPI002DBC5D3E|nr:hypothetical protein [Schinkia azotoformans]MEC1778416.1 hypothetical protein [Schinkia azotoformans]MED4328339.1 hypothetical protein [Schinkia azotoformans]